jgi:hypothetical protein
MKILSFLSLLISTSLFATELTSEFQSHNLSYSISNFGDQGSRVFYSCDTVENEVETLLTQLGAKSIRVSCTGGINIFNPTFSSPAYVRVSFDSLTQGQSSLHDVEVVNIKIKALGSLCHLIKESFNNVRKSFVITNAKQRRCGAGYSSQFEKTILTFDILKEAH